MCCWEPRGSALSELDAELRIERETNRARCRVTHWVVPSASARSPENRVSSSQNENVCGVLAIFFGAVVYVLWTSDVSRALRWLGTLLACLLVLGVAASRIYLKVHWLSDVIGGLVGGVTYLLVVLLLIDRRLRAATP